MVTAYQPYWTLRAHLLARAQDSVDACDAYAHAIALSRR